MSNSNRGNRKRLVVSGLSYLSSTKTHFKSIQDRPGNVTLTLYLEGYTQSFFRLYFREVENPNLIAGDFAGYVSEIKSDFVVNLNRPGAIVAIIKKALQEGWNPSSMTKPIEVIDGMNWIKSIKFPEDKGNAKT